MVFLWKVCKKNRRLLTNCWNDCMAMFDGSIVRMAAWLGSMAQLFDCYLAAGLS